MNSERNLVVLDHGSNCGQAQLLVFQQNGRLVSQGSFEPIRDSPYSKCRFLDVCQDRVFVVDLGEPLPPSPDFYFFLLIE